MYITNLLFYLFDEKICVPKLTIQFEYTYATTSQKDERLCQTKNAFFWNSPCDDSFEYRRRLWEYHYFIGKINFVHSTSAILKKITDP